MKSLVSSSTKRLRSGALPVFVGCGTLLLASALVGQVRLPLDPPGEGRPNPGRVVERPADAQLRVPAGFTVSLYADDLEGVRTMQFAPNGDLFVTQTTRNVTTVLRDTDRDGSPDARTTYAQGPAPVGRRGGGGGNGGVVQQAEAHGPTRSRVMSGWPQQTDTEAGAIVKRVDDLDCAAGSALGGLYRVC